MLTSYIIYNFQINYTMLIEIYQFFTGFYPI